MKIRVTVKLWSCNFSSQLANALIIEGDYHSAISALESGYDCAAEICYPELQVFSLSSLFLFGPLYACGFIVVKFYLFILIWCLSDVLCNFCSTCAPHAMV